ncbi:MAG: hypothetical protein KJO13_09895 [Gammaproteobacteria bacterium]|nr:hypothetical protein [Gammaproteobacteria bacterium]
MTQKITIAAGLVLVAIIVGLSLVAADNASEEELTVVAEHMHSHVDKVIALKAAVINGDLESAREPATWLAEHKAPIGMPSAWAPYEEDMRRFADVAATAADLETAAMAVSEIGQACGDCHIASGFRVSFGYAKPPPQALENNVTQMQRHLWAADRMWASLIGPSDAAWDSGTGLLAEVNLKADQLTRDPRKQPRVGELVQAARAVGETGRNLESVEGRTDVYGEFLAICANCHALTGGGPRY